MSISISTESLLRLSDVAKLLPGRPRASSIARWAMHGVRGGRLESCLIGGRRYTSREALERFIAATTAAADSVKAPPRTTRQRERDIAAAERELTRRD